MEETRRQHSELIIQPKKNEQKTGFETQRTAPESTIKDTKYFNYYYYIPFWSSDSYEINQEVPVTTGHSERILHIPTDKITIDSPGTRKAKKPVIKRPTKTAAQTNIGRTQTASTTYYIWSFDGRLMAEYDQTDTCTREYIYLGNTLLAEYHPPTGKYYYQFQDQVNSTRLVTDDDGNVVYSATYGPYGDIQKEWVNTYHPKQKYSGKERDSYTDLDYFGARYYDNTSYRFISVDPVRNREEAIVNPQLWNLYSYCRNNPITLFDPLGMEVREGSPDDIPKPPGCNEGKGWRFNPNGKYDTENKNNRPGNWTDPEGNRWEYDPDPGNVHGGPHWDVEPPHPSRKGKFDGRGRRRIRYDGLEIDDNGLVIINEDNLKNPLKLQFPVGNFSFRRMCNDLLKIIVSNPPEAPILPPIIFPTSVLIIL